MTSPNLLTRAEAAKHLGLTLRTFRRHVQFAVVGVFVGTRKMFTEEDLDRWVEEHKGIKSSGDMAGPRSTSRTKGSAIASPSVLAIEQRLLRGRRTNMPRLFPVADEASSKAGRRET